MPIMLSLGRTPEEAYNNRIVAREERLSDDAEGDLYEALEGVGAELLQLRRLGPAPACTDEYFTKLEVEALVRDIQWVLDEGVGGTVVITSHLREELTRLITWLRQAIQSEFCLHAHID